MSVDSLHAMSVSFTECQYSKCQSVIKVTVALVFHKQVLIINLQIAFFFIASALVLKFSAFFLSALSCKLSILYRPSFGA